MKRNECSYWSAIWSNITHWWLHSWISCNCSFLVSFAAFQIVFTLMMVCPNISVQSKLCKAFYFSSFHKHDKTEYEKSASANEAHHHSTNQKLICKCYSAQNEVRTGESSWFFLLWWALQPFHHTRSFQMFRLMALQQHSSSRNLNWPWVAIYCTASSDHTTINTSISQTCQHLSKLNKLPFEQ